MLAGTGLTGLAGLTRFTGADLVRADTPGTSRLGDVYLYTIAPAVIFLALVVWITMTLMTSRHRWSRRTPKGQTGMPHRGPVQGGVILGSPSQRTRRDPIPPAPYRETAGRPGGAADAPEPPEAAEDRGSGAKTRSKRRQGRRR